MSAPTEPGRSRVGLLLSAVAIGVVSSIVTVIAVTALAGAGGPATFTDVPSGHPFFNEIEQVAGACIAQGFPDGSYKPGQPVTRQAMAAFLARAGGRIGHSVHVGGGAPTHGSATPSVNTAWVNIAAGGIELPDDGCPRTIKVDGHASIFTAGTAANTCHVLGTCTVELGLFVGNDQIASAFTRLNTDQAADSVSLAGLYETSDDMVVYTLRWRTFNVKAGQARTTTRSLGAAYFPFNSSFTPL